MLSTLRGKSRPASPWRHARRPAQAFAASLAIACSLVLLATGLARAGQESFDYDPLGRLVRHVDATRQLTDYEYDAAGNLLAVTRAGELTPERAPLLRSVSPPRLRQGETRTLTLTGERLAPGTLTASHAGLVLSGLRHAPGQVQVTVFAQPGVPVGTHTLSLRNAQGLATIALQVGPRLPLLSIEPSPLALPPDDTPRGVTLRLSGPDDIAHEITVGSSDPSRVSVSPASLVLAPGQTSAQVQVRPRQAGFAELRLASPLLQPVTLPVFVTSDFRGVNTSHAAAVGLSVGLPPAAAAPQASTSFHSPAVGIALGPVITGMAPRAVAAGGTQSVALTGSGLPPDLRVAVLAPEGVSATLAAASPNGAEVLLAAQASAAPGIRRLVVTDAAGVPLALADPGATELRVTTGQPTLLSTDPLFAVAGSTLQLTLRGRHLQHARVLVHPAADLRVDSAPQVSADGTELRVRVQVAALAAGGARTVQVVTPSGRTEATPLPSNQFSVVREIREDVTPIAAPSVGVAVGAGHDAGGASHGLLASPAVGLAVGPAAQRLAPAAGVRGTSLVLAVSGSGLQAVTGAALSPPDGLTLDVPAASEQGDRLLIPLTLHADAPLGPRRLTLQTAAGPLDFAVPGGDQFLVAAPVPQLDSVTPQVLVPGQVARISLRGQRLDGATGVRFEPPEGIVAAAPFTASADGTVLVFEARVAAHAASGPRAVLVQTPGGASDAAPRPGNTLHIARERGPSYDAIAAAPVGVVRQADAAPEPLRRELHAGAVGVVLAPPAAVRDESRSAFAPALGVVVGTAAARIAPHSPDGFARGSTGVIRVQGWGLGAVGAAAIAGPEGIRLGTPAPSADGTALDIPVEIADTAPSTQFGIRLTAPLAGPAGASGAADPRVAALYEAQMLFSVGGLVEALDSVSPIVLEQGKAYSFGVRGIGLRDVLEVLAEPAAGLRFGDITAQPAWSTDALGEKLTVHLRVAPDAALGPRVIRLRTPGAISGGDALPGNTVHVVAPQ